MSEPSVTHSTFVIDRSYPVAPELVFAAFSDPAKKRRWYAADQAMNLEAFESDFQVGGREHKRYRFKEGTPFPGAVLSYETIYQDIVPDRRIVVAYTLSMGDKRISSSLATFEFLQTESGTDLIFTEQGAYFEGADGPKMRETGWRSLFEKLLNELLHGAGKPPAYV